MDRTVRIGRRRERKRLRRILVIRRRRVLSAAAYGEALRAAPRKFVKEIGRKVRVVESPKKINLSDNYVETIEFLRRVKFVADELHGRFHVDLTSVEEITPAGALVLVATFDRWREMVRERRLKPVALAQWNPEVRRKLREMGFFEVLNARCHIDDKAGPNDDRYLPFLTGIGSEGDQAKLLRRKIEEFGPELADRGALYDGLVEAMTNVKHHAYGEGEAIRRWWMSASVNVANNRLTVMFLDHGLSIPATLPRSKVWEQARGWLAKLGADAFKDDARLIEAALSIEKSRTGHEYRGNGLRQDIRGYIETHEAKGRLRVLSRNGKCVFEKSAGGEESMRVERLPSPLLGTFIEWTIEEYAASEDA